MNTQIGLALPIPEHRIFRMCRILRNVASVDPAWLAAAIDLIARGQAL